ncbi:phthalate transporter [uncultured Brevundimonas sp.]|uniref:phthalate transporter n=1 Tax=uncultured Brevundimonas sp. TaxID=213418 RepID=UPI00261DC2FD|nr:phthalate transporter [uncultured Brevundimonas sp.]
MIRRLERPEDFPGQTRVTWRREPYAIVAAAALGVLWPPLILTLPLWPPRHWAPGLEVDWRLMVLFVGLLAVPGGLWLLDQERRRSGRPATRLGVIWRFMFFGGLLAAALGALFAVIQSVLQWLNAANVGEAVGGSETSLLIYGVGGLSVAVLVGVSYALWAGLCAAFIAFRPQPEVRDRLGLIGEREPD